MTKVRIVEPSLGKNAALSIGRRDNNVVAHRIGDINLVQMFFCIKKRPMALGCLGPPSLGSISLALKSEFRESDFLLSIEVNSEHRINSSHPGGPSGRDDA